jgi:hypothetical protein
MADSLPCKSTEALPFYWLAQALYNILANDASALDPEGNDRTPSPMAPAGSWNKFAGMDFKQMLQSARVFVSKFLRKRFFLFNSQAQLRHEWVKGSRCLVVSDCTDRV